MSNRIRWTYSFQVLPLGDWQACQQSWTKLSSALNACAEMMELTTKQGFDMAFRVHKVKD